MTSFCEVLRQIVESLKSKHRFQLRLALPDWWAVILIIACPSFSSAFSSCVHLSIALQLPFVFLPKFVFWRPAEDLTESEPPYADEGGWDPKRPWLYFFRLSNQYLSCRLEEDELLVENTETHNWELWWNPGWMYRRWRGLEVCSLEEKYWLNKFLLLSAYVQNYYM